MNGHTSKGYDRELKELREKIVLMGSGVEQMLADGLRAFRTRDDELARSAARRDRSINRLECEADELSLRVLATRQPVASDLRFITTALKIVTDLERLGDLAVNLAERVLELDAEPPLPPLAELDDLARVTMSTLKEALDIWVTADVDRARELLKKDDRVDEDYSKVFEKVLRMMAQDGALIYRATRLQSIAKYLERVGDHAMNIVELVVFLVEGTDVRHYDRRSITSEFPRSTRR